jgi:hypothetical protein
VSTAADVAADAAQELARTEEEQRRKRRESLRCAQTEAVSTARRILRRISTPAGMPATPHPSK